MRKVMTLRVWAPQEDGLTRQCAILVLVTECVGRHGHLCEQVRTWCGKWDWCCVWCQLEATWCQLDQFDPKEAELNGHFVWQTDFLLCGGLLLVAGSFCFDPTQLILCSSAQRNNTTKGRSSSSSSPRALASPASSAGCVATLSSGDMSSSLTAPSMQSMTDLTWDVAHGMLQRWRQQRRKSLKIATLPWGDGLLLIELVAHVLM